MSVNGHDINALILVERLSKHYPVRGGFMRSRMMGQLAAVDDVSFRINQGETYALVGESGCGKTTTAKAIMMSEAPTSGVVRFNGHDIYRMSRDDRRKYRAAIGAVFQDPWASMNPRMRVAGVVAEPLVTHRRLTKRETKTLVDKLLEEVGIDPSNADRYPHQFSGGQRQRIAIARAIALRPQLVVLDEPVSALDVSIRAQIMNLLKRLQRDHRIAYLLIAHNLDTVRFLSHAVGVMYLGQMVEQGDARSLFSEPLHPYTRALISAALPARFGVQREEIVLEGEVPSPLEPPTGCRFHPRCPVAIQECSTRHPSLEAAGNRRAVRCDLVEKPAPETRRTAPSTPCSR